MYMRSRLAPDAFEPELPMLASNPAFAMGDSAAIYAVAVRASAEPATAKSAVQANSLVVDMSETEPM